MQGMEGMRLQALTKGANRLRFTLQAKWFPNLLFYLAVPYGTWLES